MSTLIERVNKSMGKGEEKRAAILEERPKAELIGAILGAVFLIITALVRIERDVKQLRRKK